MPGISLYFLLFIEEVLFEVFQQAKPRFANTVGVPGVPEVFQRFLQAKPRFANT